MDKLSQHILHISIRLINCLGRIVRKFGISPANRSDASLLASACSRTGLSDWGDDGFRTPLRILLASYREDSNISFYGWLIIHQQLIKTLSNRLRIQDEIKRHPEILQEQIRRPLFIVSLPRTGTTLLHRLLSQDQVNRALLSWEAVYPAPAPEPDARDTDSRISRMTKQIRMIQRMLPDLASMHDFQANSPDECFPLLENSFMSNSFDTLADATKYLEWLSKQDRVLSYRYYRLQLQILQSRIPTERWILKSPYHLSSLDALLSVFPDACLVVTHRHPLKVIPSSCSLAGTLQRMYNEHVDLCHIGRKMLDMMSSAVENLNHIGGIVDSAQLFNVNYKVLVNDPVGTVRQIYKYFGYKFDGCFEERMRIWLSENPQNKHGVHRYSLEQFGLDQDLIKRRFAEYCERFMIPPE
ncbi:MAG: sulfotransferase [Planctomycetes bacterium]|nr:sulfotransferase [Planctomycetota bacterium]